MERRSCSNAFHRIHSHLGFVPQHFFEKGTHRGHPGRAAYEDHAIDIRGRHLCIGECPLDGCPAEFDDRANDAFELRTGELQIKLLGRPAHHTDEWKAETRGGARRELDLGNLGRLEQSQPRKAPAGGSILCFRPTGRPLGVDDRRPSFQRLSI